MVCTIHLRSFRKYGLSCRVIRLFLLLSPITPADLDIQCMPTMSNFIVKCLCSRFSTRWFEGLSLRARDWGFSSGTVSMAPGYFHIKIEEKEIPSCLIPCLLVVFTWQFEILAWHPWVCVK